MRVKESFVPDRWLFGEGERECTSCGVILHTAPLVLKSKPSIVLVEQLDQPGHPWGIPAGKTEDFEDDPRQTILREIKEETGLSNVSEGALQEFLILKSGDEVKIVYSVPLPSGYSSLFGPLTYKEGIWLADRQFQGEIGRVAIVPSSILFSRGHPILQNYYRWDVLHYVKAKFESLYIL